MSPDSPSYPADAGASTFLLTVRGTPVPSTLKVRTADESYGIFRTAHDLNLRRQPLRTG
jgi:hypothetical protein